MSRMEFQTAREVANQLRVDKSTIGRWITSGFQLASGTRLRLAAVKVGCAWRVTEADVTAFTERLTRDRLGEPADIAPATTKPAKRSPALQRDLERAGLV